MPRVLSAIGPYGGPVWSYRGALIETGGPDRSETNYLRMAGHPLDGMCFTAPSAVRAVIDGWLASQQIRAEKFLPST